MTTFCAATLTACGTSYEPHPKQAIYDPHAREIIYPYPCPDWSHTEANADNSVDTNYGCAVENNLAAQLENPEDLAHGHGARTPDTEITTHVIEQYRADKLPVALQPMQKDATSE